MNSSEYQTLKNDIQKWYQLDKTIEETNMKLSKLREVRNQTEKRILYMMEKNKMKDKKLNIGPCSIIYSQTLQLPNYNFDIIESGIQTIYPKQSTECRKILSAIERERNLQRKPVLSLKKRKNKKQSKKSKKKTSVESSSHSQQQQNV